MSSPSIALTYSRSDKAIDLSWALTDISSTKHIILLADTTDKPTKQIVLDAGTEAYTVEVDDYFVAHPEAIYNFVVMGTDQSDETTLVSSNQISVALIEIPVPDFDLVPLDKAFRVDFNHNLLTMGDGDGEFHAQLTGTSYDVERSITQVVVNVTTTNPLAMWQAVYNVSDMTDNNIKVGLDGLAPAVTSKADLTTDGLVNFQTYEVNVSYVSDETTDPEENTNAGSLGRGEGTTESQYVIPSLQFSKPRNVTIVETPDSNNQVDIYWNAPGNDLGKDGSAEKLTTVTKYQIYRTATDPGTDAPTFTDTLPTGEGWELVAEVTPTSTDTIYNAYSETAYTQTVSTRMWYVVRAVRILAESPSGVVEQDRDGDVDEASYGAFCAPVPFATFVHTNLDAPTLSNFATAAGVTAVTFDASSPANATSTDDVELDGDYAAQKLIVKMQAKKGGDTNYGNLQSYDLEEGTQSYSDAGQTISKLEDGTTDLSLGVTYEFNSAVYVQPGLLIDLGDEHTAEIPALQSIGTTATEYTSADANGDDKIAGADAVTRTPYSTPVAVTDLSSTALASDKTPLSTSDDGKLKLSWTSLASYDSVDSVDSRFFSAIRYRVIGSTTALSALTAGNNDYGDETEVENLNVDETTVSSLALGTSYPIKIQAYFYNDEMEIWVMGAKTSSVSSGNVPFYYPDDVASLAYDSNHRTLDDQQLTWTTPANSNGVNESDEVEFYFKIETQTNEGGYATEWQAAANGGEAGESNTYDVTTDLGNTYSAKVTSGYVATTTVDDVDTYTFTTGSTETFTVTDLQLNSQTFDATSLTLTDITEAKLDGVSVVDMEFINYSDSSPLLIAIPLIEVRGAGSEGLAVKYTELNYIFPRSSSITLIKNNGPVSVAHERANGTAAVAYLARPLAPSIALVPGDQKLDATFTNDSSNDSSMVFVRFEQALGTADLVDIPGSTEQYTGLDNGTQYTIRAKSVYKYPAGGAEFDSSEAESASDLTAIPFYKPIINSVSIDSDALTDVSITMQNNGRKLREMLVVGIPLDTDAGSAVEYKRFDEDTSNGIADVDAGKNDNAERTLPTVTFTKELKEALVVLENNAGSTASLSD